MRSTLPVRAGALVAALFLTVAPLLADDQNKETCNPPELSFVWVGYDNVRLTVKADPAQAFIVDFRYLESGRTASPKWLPIKLASAVDPGKEDECQSYAVQQPKTALEPASFCLYATPEGSTATFFMDREALLTGGGFASLRYRALPSDSDACDARLQGPEDPTVKVLDKHTLSFDVGSVFNFKGDGSWETNAEAAVVSTSQWQWWLQSGYSVRYSAIQAKDTGNGDPNQDSKGNKDDTNDDSDQVFNPFTKGGGVLETNIYALVSPLPRLPRLGLVGGWGLSSVPGDSMSGLDMRERRFVGIRNSIQALNAGRKGNVLENTQGYIQAGWATDDVWRKVVVTPGTGTMPDEIRDESDRYFFEGELEIPQIGTDWFGINLRFFANIPRSRRGPSDVRISALASIDPRKWFPGVGKGK